MRERERERERERGISLSHTHQSIRTVPQLSEVNFVVSLIQLHSRKLRATKAVRNSVTVPAAFAYCVIIHNDLY